MSTRPKTLRPPVPRDEQSNAGSAPAREPPKWLEHVSEEEHELLRGTRMSDGTVWPP